ncbi:MAG TPA: hypothetical protein VMU26_00730 [Candidatus Polarisedimenticolia bacterium]|nr:hypothetical protein [Candidatus Polarisedimenticolia bacterium]
MTLRNEDAVQLMKERAAQASDCVTFDPSLHEARIGGDGRYHVFLRATGRLVNDHSAGIDDPRPSTLRDKLAELNRRNQEFWAKRTKENE